MNKLFILKNEESQLEMGKKVEQEHKGTWEKIKNGTINTPEELYESIANEHLMEDKEYYTKLKAAKL